MEAAGDGSSQLTGEHICLGRAIMQDLVPCQPAVERKSECVLRMRMCVTERDCVCVCVCTFLLVFTGLLKRQKATI